MTSTVRPSARRTAIRRALGFAAVAIAAGATTTLGATAYAATTTSVARYAAVDDAYTSSARTALNTGAADRLVAGRLNGDSLVTYLKFKVASVPAGATVTRAQLTLTRDEHHLPGTVKLSAVAGTGWTEGALTRANQPALGAVVATVNPAAAAATVTFDVSTVVKGAGTYAFAVTSPATDDVARFRSAEYGTAGPSLNLTLSATSTTTTTTTAPAAPCAVDAKLVPTCGVLWGAAAGGFTGLPVDQTAHAWEQTVGRTSAVVHTYHRGDELFPTSTEIALAHETGKPRILMLNWKVAYGTTWAAVAAGEQDARIDREAAYLKANFTDRFFLLIHHEPENDVNTTAGSGMTPQDYVAMFRHTVQRLRADAVTNAVTMVAYMSYEKWNNQAWWYDLYPGDDVTDWIGLDSYVNADPRGFHHGDFTYEVNRTTDASKFPGYYTWATTKHPNKPFMMAEWGVFEYSADPAQKAAIYDSVLPALANMPAIKGLVYFDAQIPSGGGDTRVNSSPQALASFRKVAASPVFTVKVG